jgi:dTDP-4-dehydrorhamnose reductase
MTSHDEILSKTLITGGNGTVASYIDFGIKCNRQVLDITNMEQIMKAVNEFKPQVILHLAAETDLARCEADPAHAYLVIDMYSFKPIYERPFFFSLYQVM